MTDLTAQCVSFIVLSLAVATVSMTATKAKVSKPLRDAVKARSQWFGELFSCPYCFGHWVSLAAVAAVRPTLTASGFYPLDLLVSFLASPPWRRCSAVSSTAPSVPCTDPPTVMKLKPSDR